MQVIYSQTFSAAAENVSLESLLNEQANAQNSASVYSVLRALLLSPTESVGEREEDAVMQDDEDDDENNNEGPAKMKQLGSTSKFVTALCKQLDDAMTYLIATFNQANQTTSK